MKELTSTNWHELPEEQAVRLLESDPANSLTKDEVEARLQKFGRNEMKARKRMSEWKRFLLQFAQPLMYILLIASGVTFALGEYVDSAVIFAVTFVNAIIGFLKESKAEKAIEALSRMVLTGRAYLAFPKPVPTCGICWLTRTAILGPPKPWPYFAIRPKSG